MTWDSKPFTWETLIHHPPCYPSFSKPQLHQPSGGGFLFSSAKSLALGRVVTGLRGWTTSNKTREISTIAYQPSGWNIKVDCPKTSWILMVCWFCGDFFLEGMKRKNPSSKLFEEPGLLKLFAVLGAYLPWESRGSPQCPSSLSQNHPRHLHIVHAWPDKQTMSEGAGFQNRTKTMTTTFLPLFQKAKSHNAQLALVTTCSHGK